jgi:hypothetical protein
VSGREATRHRCCGADSFAIVLSCSCSWTSSSIELQVDGNTKVKVSGTAGKDLPSHAMNFRPIIRPRDGSTGYDGPYYSHTSSLHGEFQSVQAYGSSC